jgi:hypothetical protein
MNPYAYLVLDEFDKDGSLCWQSYSGHREPAAVVQGSGGFTGMASLIMPCTGNCKKKDTEVEVESDIEEDPTPVCVTPTQCTWTFKDIDGRVYVGSLHVKELLLHFYSWYQNTQIRLMRQKMIYYNNNRGCCYCSKTTKAREINAVT